MSSEDQKKVQLCEKYPMLVSMISDIFTVNNDTEYDTTGNIIFSNRNLMGSMTESCIKALQKFNSSSLYFLFCFIGILFVFINSAINFFNNSYNSEGKTIEQYIKFAFQVIFSLFLVCSISRFSEFFLIFFRYVLDFAWDFTAKGSLIVEEIVDSEKFQLTEAQKITYNILVTNGITGESILDTFSNQITYVLIVVKFFIPWLLSVVGKFGVLFAVMKTSITTLAYCFMYPIAAGDVNENLRQSKLIKYSKHIMAGAINLTVIVILLLVIQTVSSELIYTIIEKAKNGGENANYFEICILMALLQIVKFVACNGGATQISNHISGD